MAAVEAAIEVGANDSAAALDAATTAANAALAELLPAKFLRLQDCQCYVGLVAMLGCSATAWLKRAELPRGARCFPHYRLIWVARISKREQNQGENSLFSPWQNYR